MAKIFRPIAIRILKGCAPSIRKVLHENTTYFLCSNYAEDENIYTLNHEHTQNEAEQCLYDVTCENGHKIQVGVNAVVGKNGEGKSSLIEAMIRIINNFSYTYGFLSGQEDLAPVSGLHAIFYYAVGKSIYSIVCEGYPTSVYKDGILLNGLSPQASPKEKKIFLKQVLKEGLFYTIIENYSLYAYNSKILDKESGEYGSWIKGLFHKNDAYQTPIVINPMRSDGNINVNREASLSHQRLMSIFTQAETEVQRRINERQFAHSFVFSKEENSKLILKTIIEYFNQAQGDFVEWNVMEIYDKADLENAADNFMLFWKDFCNLAYQNEALMNIISEYAKTLDISEHQETDLCRYLSRLQQNSNAKMPIEILTMLSSFTVGSFKWMNYRQFYRLWCIMMIWDILKNEKTVKRYLKHSLNENIENKCKTRNAAELYVLYKVMSIIETYEDYSQHGLLYDDTYYPLLNDKNKFDTRKQLEYLIQNILKRDDYVTLKLRQTLNFLKRDGDDDVYGASTCNYKNIDFEYAISFNDLKKKIKRTTRKSSLSDVMQMLPPPIFNGDILLSDGHEFVLLNSLSSGETQRLNSIGSFIYHLRNLDDNVRGEATIQYRKVMVVFEEVELYFHPEYQRTFLAFLLNQIKNANFKHLTHLSIILVTHSPFVLSDVLPSNLCCLSEGFQSKNVIYETFGANIYELLRNPFFLKEKGVIGGYVQQIIEEIIKSLNNTEITKREKQLLKQKIKLIDEPLMRNALEREYNSRFDNSYDIESEIARLNAEIRRLKAKKKNVAFGSKQ